jgi:hypothetical protein
MILLPVVIRSTSACFGDGHGCKHPSAQHILIGETAMAQLEMWREKWTKDALKKLRGSLLYGQIDTRRIV